MAYNTGRGTEKNKPYATEKVNKVTLEELKARRGESLKTYQSQVLSLKKEIKNLQQQKDRVSNDYTRHCREQQKKLDELADTKTDLLLENGRVQTDIYGSQDKYSKVSLNINQAFSELKRVQDEIKTRELDFKILEQRHETKVLKIKTLKNDILKEIDHHKIQLEKIQEDGKQESIKNQQDHKKHKLSLVMVKEEYDAWCAKADQARDVIEKGRQTQTNLASQKKELFVTMEDRAYIEACKKSIEREKNALKNWNDELTAKKIDLKLIDRALDIREKTINRKEKILRAAQERALQP